MPTRGRVEPVTAAKDLKEIRCSGTFRNEPCGRILCKSTVLPIKPGALVELKCGKCDQVNYIIGGPEA